MLKPLLRPPLSPLLRASAASIGFTPYVLFAGGQQGAWFEPSSAISAPWYQDSAATTPITAVEQVIGNARDKSGNANHALQATAAARPVLSARVNLLTKSEDFTDAAWSKGNCSVVANKIIEDATLSEHNLRQDYSSATPSTFYTFYADLEARERTRAQVLLTDAVTGDIRATFDLLAGTISTPVAATGNWDSASATIESISSGRYRCAVTGRKTAAGNAQANGALYLNNGVSTSYQGDGTSGLYAASAQLDSGPTTTRYQRVNTATDYDTTGFSFYEKYDGIDDSLSSTTGGGGTTGFFWCGAVKPTGGAGTARTLWSDAGSNGGYRVRINASNQLELAAGNGTPLTPPVANTPTTSTTGGTLAAATYYYKITAINALGESLASNEVSVTTTGTTSSNTVTWGAVAGATSYRVYRGTAAGAENVFYAPGNVTSFLDTGAANTAGSPPTTTDTAYTKIATVATLPVGESHVAMAWDDGTNLNVQIDAGTVASVARPVVSAGTAVFTLGKDNGAATSFFTGNGYAEVYTKNSGLTAAQRALTKNYVAQQAGVTL